MSDQPDIALRVKDLHKSFGPLKVLRGTTLAFASSDSSAALAAHVDLSRNRVIKAHLLQLQQLAAGAV